VEARQGCRRGARRLAGEEERRDVDADRERFPRAHRQYVGGAVQLRNHARAPSGWATLIVSGRSGATTRVGRATAVTSSSRCRATIVRTAVVGGQTTTGEMGKVGGATQGTRPNTA